jgi:general secretion pathway protein B
MSYILEALKRAERERAQAGNPVAGDPSAPQPAPRSGGNALLKILIAALAVNAIVIGVLVMRHKPDAKGETQATAPQPSQLAAQAAGKPAIATAPAPPPQASEPAQEQPAVQEGVSSMDDLGASDANDESGGNDEAAQVPKTPAVAAVEHHGSVTFARKPLTPEVPEPAQDENVQQEVTSEPESQAENEAPPVDDTPEVASAQPIARPAPPAAASIAPPASAPGSVKPLSDMSAAYQGAFPQFTLQVHVFDASAQKRFAIIDGTRYREGDSLPQGARIVQIVADGLVMDFHNERVLYPLGRH